MSEHWRPSARRESLYARAEILRRIRHWFYERNVLEVETPLLVSGATTDLHIDSFEVAARALRTSSEFHQKRLLCAGIGDNYELGKVFRIDESGRFHNPEFTMLEWYRCGIDHHDLIDEVADLLSTLHGEHFPGLEKTSYRNLWLNATGIDIALAGADTIYQCINENGVDVPAEVRGRFDDLLNLGMATFLSDSMAKDSYTCIYHYPASQASLSRIAGANTEFPYACRFEVFFGPLELANGYYELNDAVEQQSRFESDNKLRLAHGKNKMPVDYNLIAALDHGLPDCAGVAMGVDRLMMILLDDIEYLSETLSFDWQRA